MKVSAHSVAAVGPVLLVRVGHDDAGAHPRHCHPPLNLWYAQAGLVGAGISADVWDQWVMPESELPLAHYRVVVVMAQSASLQRARTLAEQARAAGAITCCVGQQACHYRDGGRDYWDRVIEGEFEQALVTEVQALSAEPATVEGGIPLARPRVARLDDPDQLPPLQVTAEQLSTYPFPLPVRGGVVRRWGYVQTAWGCPFACDHCTDVVRKSSGTRLRRRSISKVLADIEQQLAAGAEGIVFEDDTLLCSPRHFQALCEGMIDRGWRFPWVANARPDELDEARVGWAAAAGAVLLKLGIETADSILARQIGKYRGDGCWRELCETGLARLQRAGIGALGLLMTGMPGETAAQHRATCRWLQQQPLDYLQVQIYTAYPDVALAAPTESDGALSHYAVGASAERQTYARWQRRLYRHFYLRAGFAWRHLHRCWRWYLSPWRWQQLVAQAGFVLSGKRGAR